MTIRVRRRLPQNSTLEEMTDEELKELYFFGYAIAGRVVTYRATPDEKRRAGEILEERGAFRSRPKPTWS